MQVITIVEASVPEDKETALKAAYEALGSFPKGLLQSFLLHNGSHVWRIVSMWESKEALEHMRHTTDKPAALAVFESVGIKPTVTIWEAASEKL